MRLLQNNRTSLSRRTIPFQKLKKSYKLALSSIVCGFALSVWMLATLLGNLSHSSSTFMGSTNRSLRAEASVSSEQHDAAALHHHPKVTLSTFPCSSLVHPEEKYKYNVSDPNQGFMHARQTDTDPNFWISLHTQNFDKPRWSIMESGHYYETGTISIFQEILSRAPSTGTRVLDVGGNIGFYSLLSASLGATVDAFEPNIKNILRFCESLSLNRLNSEYDTTLRYKKRDETSATLPFSAATTTSTKPPAHVNLYQLGIGKETGYYAFREKKYPGRGSFINQRVSTKHDSLVPLVTLDEFAEKRRWFQLRPDIAILKIDVKGFEWNVIEGAQELLKAQLVRNIFIEVSAMTEMDAEQILKTQMILDAGYELYQTGGFTGPTNEVTWPSDNNLPQQLVEIVQERSTKQLNLWFVRRGDRPMAHDVSE